MSSQNDLCGSSLPSYPQRFKPVQQTVPVVPISAAYRRRHRRLQRKNGEPTLLAGFVGAVEAVTLELNRHGGIHLAHLLLRALGAHGNRVVIERLLFGEVIAAVLATVMIGRQRIPPTKSYFSRMAQTPCHATVHILVAALTHWRYGLTSQLAVATLVPSASVRGWLVSLACAEYLGRPASSTGPMS